MNILVATDLSERSEFALDRALQLGRELAGKVTVAHVVENATPAACLDQAISQARAVLAERLDRRATGGIHIHQEVVAGDPRAEIARLANVRHADLIVLGRHSAIRRSPTAGFARTTTGAILRSTIKAVLVVAGDVRGPYGSAVVGVDFSLFSVAAVRQAVRFAPHAQLHLVHAYHVPFGGFLCGSPADEDTAYAERLQLDAFLQGEMALLAQRAADPTRQVRASLEEGPPVDVLRQACQRLAADLIVIGTHSRGNLSRAIFGSVACALLDRPRCDVLVVKPYAGPETA